MQTRKIICAFYLFFYYIYIPYNIPFPWYYSLLVMHPLSRAVTMLLCSLSCFVSLELLYFRCKLQCVLFQWQFNYPCDVSYPRNSYSMGCYPGGRTGPDGSSWTDAGDPLEQFCNFRRSSHSYLEGSFGLLLPPLLPLKQPDIHHTGTVHHGGDGIPLLVAGVHEMKSWLLCWHSERYDRILKISSFRQCSTLIIMPTVFSLISPSP
jgi:hypothetical protein